MKKTSKSKKFSDGGLYEAISRVSGPSRDEMMKSSVSEMISKIPRGSSEAIESAMSAAKTPRAPRGDMSEFAEFTARKPGRVTETFDEYELPMRVPGRMKEITVGPEFMPQMPTQVGDEVGGILPGGREKISKKIGDVEEAIGRMRRPTPPGLSRFSRPRESVMYKKGGKVSSASSRGDGIATKGKTKGRMI